MWDVVTGREVRRLNGYKAAEVCVAFAPNGRMLASGNGDSTVNLWEVATGGVRLRLEQKVQIDGLAFSDDGRSLASGGADGAIRLWNIRMGEVSKTWPGHQGRLFGLAFSPDNRRLLSVSADTTVLVWDVSAFARDDRPRSVRLRPKELPALWSQLASANAAVAYRAMVRLVSSPADAVSCLRPRLRPVPAITNARLSQLIASLDSDSFAEREAADRELEGLAEAAIPALEHALKKSPTLEARRRMEGLLVRLRGTPSSEQIRLLRSVEVLEGLGTAEARDVLRTLAKGTGQAPLTQEARASLNRLEKRSH